MDEVGHLPPCHTEQCDIENCNSKNMYKRSNLESPLIVLNGRAPALDNPISHPAILCLEETDEREMCAFLWTCPMLTFSGPPPSDVIVADQANAATQTIPSRFATPMLTFPSEAGGSQSWLDLMGR